MIDYLHDDSFESESDLDDTQRDKDFSISQEANDDTVDSEEIDSDCDDEAPHWCEFDEDKFVGDPIYEYREFYTPDWLKDKWVKTKATYVLKRNFTKTEWYKFQHKYRLAVYAHIKNGMIAQRRAVFAILWHECDHKDSTIEQKKFYHRFCDSRCHFFKYWQEKKPLEKYEKNSTVGYKDDTGELVKKPWVAGIFAGMDTSYPLAFEQLIDHTEIVANCDLLSRCGTMRTTNANESIHSKIWGPLLKIKHHGVDRVKHGIEQVVMVHNFGHYRGSLLHVLGCMSAAATKALKQADKDAERVSKRVYRRFREGNRRGKTHRPKMNQKLSQDPPENEDPDIQPQSPTHDMDVDGTQPQDETRPPQQSPTPGTSAQHQSPTVQHSIFGTSLYPNTPPSLTPGQYSPLYSPPPFPPSPSPLAPSDKRQGDETPSRSPSFLERSSSLSERSQSLSHLGHPSSSNSQSLLDESSSHTTPAPSCPRKKRKNETDHKTRKSKKVKTKSSQKKHWIQSGVYGQDDD